MKKQLSKKLYAFIVTTMMFFASANAQIVYTDVNPDYVISIPVVNPIPTDYNIDLNNDGISDYKISCSFSFAPCQFRQYVSYVKVSALNTNAVVAVSGSTNPLAMNFNDGILSGFTFSTSGYLRYVSGGYCGSSTLGVWPNSVDRYLGLKLIVGANAYYGWVRMQVSVGVNPFSCTIKDYAYNSVPNQPIVAGQTTCALPTVNVSASGATTFCYGSSVSLTADSVSGYTFQWQKNTVAISGATARTYKVTTSGSYSVITTNACGTATSTPLSCTRILNPTPVISTTDPLTYCAGQAINTMFTANTYTGVTYQWQKNSVNIGGAIAQNFTATATGNYRVRETANGCSRTSSAKSIIINCRIGEDISNESLLSIYPNPANNYITVQFPSAQSAIISVTNLFGQIVYSEKINAEQTQIDVSRFAAGMYVIRWSSGENFETKTFSVTK